MGQYMCKFFTFLYWRVVRDTGAHIYSENDVTGERRAVTRSGSGYQPLDQAWLDAAPNGIQRSPQKETNNAN